MTKRISVKKTIGTFFAVGLAIFISIVGYKAYGLYKQLKDPDAIEFWAQSDPQNTQSIDHSLWQGILSAYVIEDTSGINLFDYGNVSDEHYADLETYLQAMAGIDPRKFNEDEQMAYWINIYNAITVLVIVDEYPVDSIKQTGEGLPGLGPWEDKLIEVQGQSLSLNNIEHGILRRVWNDNRIHYGVNCASIGCPNLSKTAFTGANLNEQLTKGAIDFINSSRGVHFSEDDGSETLTLSSIFNWFASDFGGNEESLLLDLQQYADEDLKQQLKNYDGQISYDYDWNLNSPAGTAGE